MSNQINHPYHLVDESPWPLTASLFGLGLTVGLIKLFYFNNPNLVFLSLFGLALLITQWWRDVSREGSLVGLHSQVVELGLRWGIALFIVSEVFFFVSFFWAYFHRSLGPNVEVGAVWPPTGVKPFNPFGVPLLNRIILLSSGVSVTWAHHSLIAGNHSRTFKGLGLTIILGVYFTALQALEYWEAPFAIRDRSYGSAFFTATGFHGLHVIVGTLFLLATFLRFCQGSLRHSHHFGFEAAAWYWHFVDVVWLFLYVSIYWWGAK